jgi:hypothetical protein
MCYLLATPAVDTEIHGLAHTGEDNDSGTGKQCLRP